MLPDLIYKRVNFEVRESEKNLSGIYPGTAQGFAA